LLDWIGNGEADIIVRVSVFHLIKKAFQNAGIHVMRNIDKGDCICLVTRKDRETGNVSPSAPPYIYIRYR
jgi:hypothetical protein